jgi:hypothetical protein
VYTPYDKAIQTPNSDTPYSFVGADLRADPLVLSVPAIEQGRYYSLQFIDMYTFDFAYVGSRATGNGAGDFVLAGPHWKGQKPEHVRSVIRCETDFAFVLYRTQLFNPDDIENVKKIQAGYKVQSLSHYLGKTTASEGAASRICQAAASRAGTYVARVLYFAGLPSSVLSGRSIRTSAQGALRQDRDWGREAI